MNSLYYGHEHLSVLSQNLEDEEVDEEKQG